jgi:hypothetical protein
MYSGHTKHFGAVPGSAGLHHLSISFPVPLPKTLWNNQIKRMTESLALGVPEDPFRRWIPKDN